MLDQQIQMLSVGKGGKFSISDMLTEHSWVNTVSGTSVWYTMRRAPVYDKKVKISSRLDKREYSNHDQK